MKKKNSKATMEDVARLAGVSMMTVSRVLGNEAKVRTATRRKVQEAIKALDYQPNVSARSLASARSHLIAFLYENPSEGYVAQLLIGAMNTSRARGYNLVLSNVEHNPEGVEEELRSLIVNSRVDGVILTPPYSDSETILDMLSGMGLPTIRISPQRKEYPFPFVCMDETVAAFEMTEYLIAMGHSKIAFIQGHPDHSGSHLRYDGFRQAMQKHELAVPDTYIEQGMFNYKSGFAAAEALMALEDRPTAIFASNDDMAAAVISAAQKHHLKVPEELSVAGFDDAPIATSIWPCLTTVRQPILDMAEKATDLLITEITGRTPEGQRRKTVLEYELAKRDTVQRLTGQYT